MLKSEKSAGQELEKGTRVVMDTEVELAAGKRKNCRLCKLSRSTGARKPNVRALIKEFDGCLIPPQERHLERAEHFSRLTVTVDPCTWLEPKQFR